MNSSRRSILGVAGAAALAPILKLWTPTPQDVVVAAEADVTGEIVAIRRTVEMPFYKSGFEIGKVFYYRDKPWLLTHVSIGYEGPSGWFSKIHWTNETEKTINPNGAVSLVLQATPVPI
jgi:hypothetical protein